jgi:hypothetical protein
VAHEMMQNVGVATWVDHDKPPSRASGALAVDEVKEPPLQILRHAAGGFNIGPELVQTKGELPVVCRLKARHRHVDDRIECSPMGDVWFPPWGSVNGLHLIYGF